MNDFDLILHGHRHVRSFSKLSYNVRNRTLRAMSVLAASSPTAGDISSAEHSYNLIDLHHTGRISVVERFNGEGVGANDARPTVGGNPNAVSHAEQKLRTYERARRIQQVECNLMARTLHINDMAIVDHSFKIAGLMVANDSSDFTYTHELAVDLGVIDRRTIQLDKEVSTPGVELACLAGHSEGQTAAPRDEHVGQRMRLRFTIPTTGTQSATDFAVNYSTANNFRLSRWEMMERGDPGANELMSMRIRLPTRSLRIELKLPDSHVDVKTFLRCYRLASYPLLTIDADSRLIDFPGGSESLVYDADATNAESEAKSLSKLGQRTWFLDVDYPQIGFVYQLTWEVRDSREASRDVSIEGEVRSLWTSALRRRATALKAPLRGRSTDYFTQVLMGLLKEFRIRFPSVDPAAENTRLCFLSYEGADDKTTKAPRIVAVEEVLHGTSAEEIALEDYWMPFGDGTSGLAFKAANPHLYCANSAPSPSGGRSPMFALAAKLKLQGVLALPIFHPRAWARIKQGADEGGTMSIGDLPTSAETIGVLTFASDSAGTGLTKLYRQGPSTNSRAKSISELQDVVQNCAPALVKGLLS